MTRFILTLVAAIVAVTALPQSTDAVLRDKITDAVMRVYDEHLAANPNDYNTLFARAHQHYYDGDYTSALADVNQAMMLTPKTDKELRFDEYILRARISDARRDYTGALADLRLAHELEPKSLACTDLMAKANLKAGNLDAAEKEFKTILRAESMNYDAMYGLAQVETARGNNKAAIEHVTKAISLFRVEPQVYVNRADIFARQGNIDAAVRDLLDGMSVGDGGVAAQRLFDLSDVYYDAVMRSLADLSDRATDGGGLYRFLRANVAMDHTRYYDALQDLDYLRQRNLFGGYSLLSNAARCHLELGQYDEAVSLADQAIASDASQPEGYILKSLAEYYAGGEERIDAALATLDQCAAVAPQSVEMLIAKASLYSRQGNDNKALGYLNAALANEPGNAEALFTRALTLKRLSLNNLAERDLNTMRLLSDDVFDLKGLGLNALGADGDAFRWLQQITSTDMVGGENYYYAALFMAQRGDNFRAKEYLEKALSLGFGSQHRLQREDLFPVTLTSLRNEPGFDLLLDKARRNFTERY